MPIDAGLIALETLQMRRRQLTSELLSFDGYDRWGSATDTEENRARMSAAADAAAAASRQTVKELEALIVTQRRDRPHTVEAWVQAHDLLLAEFIAAIGDAPEHATARYVAEEERKAWTEVARGTRPSVDENTFYVRVDPERRRALLGV